MKYFLPWWPSDFVRAEWTPHQDLSRVPSQQKKYLWEYSGTLVDGLLVSRWPLGKNGAAGLRQKLRYDGFLFGDSGAHSYRSHPHPPYSCEELLAFYETGEFDAGVVLDMVADPKARKGGLTKGELRDRLEMTIENAAVCQQIHQQNAYTFELVGVVQGWDRDSYHECASRLLALNFTYIAIAGQPDVALLKDVISDVRQLIDHTSPSTKIHVLGSGNPKMLQHYVDERIDSFDSLTWFRQAWLSRTSNYYLAEGRTYTSWPAHRFGLGDLGESKAAIPEPPCTCMFCTEIGADILLFRGRQRNFRRAFHNIYQYVKLLDEYRAGTNEAALSSCQGPEDDGADRVVPMKG